MSNIINLNGKINDGKNKLLKKINDIFTASLNSIDKDDFNNLIDGENYRFLLANYIKINNKLKDICNDDLDSFYSLILNNIKNDKVLDVYTILNSFDLFRIYNLNICDLSQKNFNLACDLLSSFEEDHDIKKLDSLCSFIDNKELCDMIESISISYNELKNMIINCGEIYLESNELNAPIDYYIKNELKKYTSKDTVKLEKTKLNSISDICNYINDLVFNLAAVLYINDKTMAFDYMSKFNNLEFKLRNLSDGDLEKCLFDLRIILNDDLLYAKEKIDLIDDKINYYLKGKQI